MEAYQGEDVVVEKAPMHTVFITELPEYPRDRGDGFVLDLCETAPRECVGCWNCWIKTPGRCVHHDLDAFYRAVLSADKAVFYLNARLGFASNRLKTLFDRLIPHYLPDIRYDTGESRHAPRYERYPDVEVQYAGEFLPGERQIFEDYLARVFYQFYMRASIHPLDCEEGEAPVCVR